MADELSTADASLNFGQRMAMLRGGRSPNPRGRPPIAEKYRRQIGAAERAFADDLPQEAERYVDELTPKEPEQCPQHRVVLRCPAPGCVQQSQRTAYNHEAARYVFDRIMGKPSIRVEADVTVRLVESLTIAFTQAFLEINDLADPERRREAFADRCAGLGALYGGSAA